MLKTSRIAVVLLLSVLFLFNADLFSGEELFVVESVAAYTNLGHSNIRETHDVWRERFENAEELIQIGAFYIAKEEGSIFNELMDIVYDKGREGVEVQILVDYRFNRNSHELLKGINENENVEVRWINYSEILGGVMHAKYFIVDSKYFYLGSANFDWRALEHIREIGLAGNTSHLVEGLQKLFEIDWTLANDVSSGELKPAREWNIKQKLVGDELTYNDVIEEEAFEHSSVIVASPPCLTPSEFMTSEEALIRLINSAKRELFIDLYGYQPFSRHAREGQNPYWDNLDRALRRAASRGVNVMMMLPHWAVGSPSIDYLKSLHLIPNITVKIITFDQAPGGHIPFARVSHSKLMIVDRSYAWMGTTNWGMSYFRNGRNIDIVTSDNKIISDFRQFFLSGWNSVYVELLDVTKEYMRPFRGE